MVGTAKQRKLRRYNMKEGLELQRVRNGKPMLFHTCNCIPSLHLSTKITSKWTAGLDLDQQGNLHNFISMDRKHLVSSPHVLSYLAPMLRLLFSSSAGSEAVFIFAWVASAEGKKQDSGCGWRHVEVQAAVVVLLQRFWHLRDCSMLFCEFKSGRVLKYLDRFGCD